MLAVAPDAIFKFEEERGILYCRGRLRTIIYDSHSFRFKFFGKVWSEVENYNAELKNIAVVYNKIDPIHPVLC